MKLKFLPLIALVAANVCAHADTVALWAYDTATTKHTQSANGARFSTVGDINQGFLTDGVTTQALRTDGYAAQGTNNLSQGVEFDIQTLGYTNLVLTFAQSNSNTASAWTQLQYTVDGGINWIMAKDFLMPSAQSNTFVSGLTYDFSSITEANDNASFGVRMLAMYAPGTGAYAPTLSTSAYDTAGTISYDNVLLTGTAIPDPTSPVPEPHTYALMLGGLMALGVVARRRRAS